MTVLHRDTKGNEHLMEAMSVEWIGQSYEDTERGVVVRFADGCATHIGEAKCRSSGDVNPEVFVMNGEGQTVARYRL